MNTQSNDGGELDHLKSQLDEFARRHSLVEKEARRERLQTLSNFIGHTVQEFAATKGLQRWQRGDGVHMTAGEEWAGLGLAMVFDDQNPVYQDFRLEGRGPNEVALVVEGNEIWRGDEPDQELTDAVLTAALNHFLSQQES